MVTTVFEVRTTVETSITSLTLAFHPPDSDIAESRPAIISLRASLKLVSREGLADGDPLGDPLGEALGDPDGEADGDGLSEALGLPLGDPDGLPDGLPEGEADGEGDSEALGDPLGDPEGEPLGDPEGDDTCDLNTTPTIAASSFSQAYEKVLVPAVASAIE